MSYDLYFQINTGGDYPATVGEVGNMTSNVSGMWSKALGRPLRDFEGYMGRDLIAPVSEAIARMEDDDWTYKQMNPENGWGSYEGAIEYLRKIRDMAVRHPKARLHVSC